MLEYLRDKGGNRKVRLFFCGLARQGWHLLRGQSAFKAVEAAEQYADGEVSKGVMAKAGAAAQHAACTAAVGGTRFKDVQTANAFVAARWAAYTRKPELFGFNLANGLGLGTDTKVVIALLRCIFHNPFQLPAAVAAAWLTWNGGTIVQIAKAIYADRAFDRLPILADALEEAGCTDAAIIDHCRGPGPHVRGCWVVDLLLGKK
jgi:hypothetical protein